MTNTATKPKILCVDDEPRVLEGLQLTLRRDYEMIAARSGPEALKVLELHGDAAVVISDMRMPVMDGAAFLSQVRKRWPETTRLLLTGESSRDAAVSAVNEGQIFRFLTKPCKAEHLSAAVAAAVRQHELMVSERVLLRETVLGSIRALVDILAIVNPSAFGRTGRIRRLSLELAALDGNPVGWELEAAALVSQLGFVSLSTEVAEKIHSGVNLNPVELKQLARVPAVTQGLLARIPRLEGVVQILSAAGATSSTGASSGPAPGGPDPHHAREGNVLAATLLFDSLVSRGESPAEAVRTLRARKPAFDSRLLDNLARLRAAPEGEPAARELLLRDVTVGMVLLDELRNDKGALLGSAGYEISASFLQRMDNFNSIFLSQRVRVQMPTARPPPGFAAAATGTEKGGA